MGLYDLCHLVNILNNSQISSWEGDVIFTEKTKNQKWVIWPQRDFYYCHQDTLKPWSSSHEWWHASSVGIWDAEAMSSTQTGGLRSHTLLKTTQQMVKIVKFSPVSTIKVGLYRCSYNFCFIYSFGICRSLLCKTLSFTFLRPCEHRLYRSLSYNVCWPLSFYYKWPNNLEGMDYETLLP